MGNIGFLSAADVRRGMGGRAVGGIRGRSFVHRRLVPQRHVQRRGISASADSRLERDHAFYILFRCRLAADCIPTFSLPPGANSRAANSRAADGDGRTKTAGTRQAPGGASRRGRSMAAQVAHEIRNPLGSISLNLDLIGEELNAFANSSGSSAAECRRAPARNAFAGIANPPGAPGVSPIRANAEVRACRAFAAAPVLRKNLILCSRCSIKSTWI